MAAGGRNWELDELEHAVALYVRTTFGRIHSRNPEIIDLAVRLGRTPSSVAMKMANLASIDETLDRKGLKHATNRDREAFARYFQRLSQQAGILPNSELDRERPVGAGENAQAEYEPPTGAGIDLPVIGTVRQGQQLFREIVLTSYDHRCAITGIRQPGLLVAGHIRSWASDSENRMNPRNGICLNRLHDRAFEAGMIAIAEDGHILYSKRLAESDREKLSNMSPTGNFSAPKRFAPDPQFLLEHRRRFDHWIA
jgi:hypothetical protein